MNGFPNAGRRVQLLWLSMCLILLSACSKSSPPESANLSPPSKEESSVKTPVATPAPSPSSNEVSNKEPTFLEVNTKVFVPHCVRCHGAAGGVNLDSYARVLNDIDAIYTAVLAQKKMPPDERLTSDESDILEKWIKAGAPKGAL